ncbi:hypothetical protein ACHAO8_006098 [Botrytis cinerea]
MIRLFPSCAILGGNLMPHTIYLGSGLVQARMREFDDGNEKYQELRTSPSPFASKLYRPSLWATKSYMSYTVAELCIILFIIANFVNSAILIIAAASLSPDNDVLGIVEMRGWERGGRENTASLANGWVVMGVGWLLWFLLAEMNVVLLTFLGLGIGGND